MPGCVTATGILPRKRNDEAMQPQFGGIVIIATLRLLIQTAARSLLRRDLGGSPTMPQRQPERIGLLP